MSTSLEKKIEARSGRLQLIVAQMAKIARANGDDHDTYLEPLVEELAGMAAEYGTEWLDECAMLLKDMYNRKRGQ